MNTAAVTTERRDGVLIVHLDDGKVNALSFEMVAAIAVALDEAEGDDEIRAMVLHGRPGKFSAGFDLGVMFGDDMSAIINLVADGGALVHRLYGSTVPVACAAVSSARTVVVPMAITRPPAARAPRPLERAQRVPYGHTTRVAHANAVCGLHRYRLHPAGQRDQLEQQVGVRRP